MYRKHAIEHLDPAFYDAPQVAPVKPGPGYYLQLEDPDEHHDGWRGRHIVGGVGDAEFDLIGRGVRTRTFTIAQPQPKVGAREQRRAVYTASRDILVYIPPCSACSMRYTTEKSAEERALWKQTTLLYSLALLGANGRAGEDCRTKNSFFVQSMLVFQNITMTRDCCS